MYNYMLPTKKFDSEKNTFTVGSNVTFLEF